MNITSYSAYPSDRNFTSTSVVLKHATASMAQRAPTKGAGVGAALMRIPRT